MAPEFALIGGTGIGEPGWLVVKDEQVVETPYGAAMVRIGEIEGVRIAFVPRHGPGHTVPPHRINYRANVWALKEVGAHRVIATAAVGSLNEAMAPGDLVLVDQFLDFTRARPSTFFEGGPEGVVHTDVTDPYCRYLRAVLGEEGGRLGFPIHAGGVYVTTEGPRYESRAEIRAYRMLGGDVIGMTGVPEVVLARELGLCYATVAMVTNMAAGMTDGRVTHEEVEAVMATHGERLRRLITGVVARSHPDPGDERTCDC